MNNAIPIAKKVLDSTALLVTEDFNEKPLSYGSGFFVGDDLIVTNLHVVHGAKKCSVKLFGKEDLYEVADYIAIDPENDLIILKIEGFDEPIDPLNLENDIPVYIGEPVYAVGNPHGYEGTISDGIISGIREDNKLIQMTAPISPGSSGGPVINNKGEVIGVSVESNNNAQNLNFAIPSIYVKKLIENVEEHTPETLLFAKTAGVVWVNKVLSWKENEELPNTYHFALLNQRRRTIRRVHCLVSFKDDRDELIHVDFWKDSEEIPAGEKRRIFRSSIFDILANEQMADVDVNSIVFAATIFGHIGEDLNARSLISPKIKQLAKTYEVKVVNFEVVE